MSDTTAVALERWSPVDALRMVVSAVALLVILLVDWLFGDDLVSFISDVLSGFRTINEDVVPVLAAVARVATLAVLIVALVSAALRGRWQFLLTAAAGAVVGALLVTLIDGLLDAAAPAVVSAADVLGFLGDPAFPTVAGLAAITGAVAAGVPWFERGQRRVGWALVLLLAFVRAFTQPVSLETVAALACGALAGALADAVFGTPSRRPTHAAVVDGLTRRRRAPRRPGSGSGRRPRFDALLRDHDRRPGPLRQGLGRDERSADLLFRMVPLRPAAGTRRRAAVLLAAPRRRARGARGAGRPRRRGSARRASSPSRPRSRTASSSPTRRSTAGRSTAWSPTSSPTPSSAGIWAQVSELRRHRIAHRDLRLANVFLAADGASG